jgi:hypothetical protein
MGSTCLEGVVTYAIALDYPLIKDKRHDQIRDKSEGKTDTYACNANVPSKKGKFVAAPLLPGATKILRGGLWDE